MDRNLISGRMRYPYNNVMNNKDFREGFNTKTSLPHKVYCSIELKTISPLPDDTWYDSKDCASWNDHQHSQSLNNYCEYDNMIMNTTERRYSDHCMNNYDEVKYSNSTYNDNTENSSWDKSEDDSSTRSCKIGRFRNNSNNFKGRIGRNARERNRVMAVSTAFLRLRRAVPQAAPTPSGSSKRLSKLKTLKSAINYIAELQSLLEYYKEKCSNNEAIKQ